VERDVRNGLILAAAVMVLAPRDTAGRTPTSTRVPRWGPRVVGLSPATDFHHGLLARDERPCDRLAEPLDCPTLADAEISFYNARYAAAAALTLALPAEDQEDLAIYELRASAWLFQLKSLIGNRPDRSAALADCVTCPELIAAFFRATASGQTLARARLLSNARDEAALFFLGKLDLNYLWLQLGLLGHRTGWNEFREARRCLDAVLERNPLHVRARVARAWIDYIVDTAMPRGTKWLLGGGNKDRALLNVRQATNTDADFFSHAEAAFSLWDMQVREGHRVEAIQIARELARVFPENRQLVIFLEGHEPDRLP
jgi:tetratricopeptide (TPR) repeat protein